MEQRTAHGRHASIDDSRWTDRKLGRTILRTYRDTLDIDEVLPNNKQPRQGPKEDLELQRQIEANEGLFEPILVEPHPDHDDKFRIIDGDRRWTNSKTLVESQRKERFRKLPAEITDRTLTEDERLRVWIYIHRQRKEWNTKEKEMVAYGLVDMVGRASAANILGITVRELDKLVDVYELSQKLQGVQEPGASITWAREIKSLNKKLLTPHVLGRIIRKINAKAITNSKDVRKLRSILKDPVAREEFMSDEGTVESASNKLTPAQPRKGEGLAGDIQALNEAIQRYSWVSLTSLRGDAQLLQTIDEVERTLKTLKKQLARS